MLFAEKGLFLFTTAFMPAFFKWCWSVLVERGWLIMSYSGLVTWVAFSAFPVWIRWIAWQVLTGESLVGHTPKDFWSEDWCFEWSLEIVAVPTPVGAYISLPDLSESRRQRIVWFEQQKGTSWQIMMDSYSSVPDIYSERTCSYVICWTSHVSLLIESNNPYNDMNCQVFKCRGQNPSNDSIITPLPKVGIM